MPRAAQWCAWTFGGCVAAHGAAWAWGRSQEVPADAGSRRLHLRRKTVHAQQTMAALIAANAAVFAAWRIPALAQTMRRWFVLTPHAHPATALLSVFSHVAPVHIACNMLALWSLGPVLYDGLGGTPEAFLAHYVSCGLLGSLGSVLWSGGLGAGFRRALAARIGRYQPPAPYAPSGSLGASGAVFGVLAGCAQTRPDMRISLIFVPFLSLPVKGALGASMAFDAAGLALRWRVFDHAAHLSGAASGLALSRALHARPAKAAPYSPKRYY